jgi:hypothetical protein
MDIEFIATISVIAADPTKSRELYVDALGLPLQAEEGSTYFHDEPRAASATHVPAARHSAEASRRRCS